MAAIPSSTRRAASSAPPRDAGPTPPARVAFRSRGRAALWVLGAAALIAVHVIALRKTDFSVSALIDGWHGMADFVGDAVPPDLSWDEVLHPSIDAALVTLWIGLLGTTLSIPLAFAAAIFAARTTTPNVVAYQSTRTVLSFLRAVPDVVFALIFVTAVGLGPFPGVLALVVHNTGVMGKLWSEAIEDLDAGPREALQVGGASRAQVVANAVLPSVAVTWTGLLLYRLDVNVRASLVLGLVGAGGIGFLINQSIQLFRFDQMLTHILVVLVLVIAVDQLSALVRRRLAA